MTRSGRAIASLGLCLLVVLSGAAGTAHAGTGTQLPFSNASLAVDPAGQHVFASGGPGNSSIVVLDFNGNVVTTITGEQGAAGMAMDTATHTLYVALADANAISEIDTTTLTETARFSTGAFTAPYRPAIAGGKLWIGTDGGLAVANLDGAGLTGAGLPGFGATMPTSSSDGNLLALVTYGQTPSIAGVFDVGMQTPNLVRSVGALGAQGNVGNVAFDSTGQNLLAAEASPYVFQAFDTRTLQPSTTYGTFMPYPFDVAASPGGRYVAGGQDVVSPALEDVYLFRSGNQTAIQSWALPHTEPSPYGPASSRVFSGLAFSPDGTRLFAATGGEFNVLTTPGADTPVSLTSAPDNKTFDTSASFSFSSPDGSVTFQCSLDGAAAQPCTSPASYGGLSAGLHTFQVQAVDADGVEGSAGQTWMVEALDTTLWSGPVSFKYATNASFVFVSHDDNATFQCSLDGSDWTPCTSPATYTQLAVGRHHFLVRAVDGAAIDPVGASEGWTIEPPTTGFTHAPDKTSYYYDASFTLTSAADKATFQCSLDGSDWAPCANPVTYPGLSLGQHTFKARAVNDAGAVDPAGAVWIWTISTPDTIVTASPPDTSDSPAASFSFNSSHSIATFQCALDGAAFASCTSPVHYTGLALGEHTFQVRSMIPSGTADPVGVSRTWTVVSPPRFSINSGAYATNSPYVEIDVQLAALRGKRAHLEQRVVPAGIEHRKRSGGGDDSLGNSWSAGEAHRLRLVPGQRDAERDLHGRHRPRPCEAGHPDGDPGQADP